MKTSTVTAYKKEWQQLFPRAAHISPFLSYEWFTALQRHLLHRSCELLTFWQGDMLVGIAPVEIIDDTLVFIADERVTDLCDIIYDQEFESDIIDALSNMIVQDGLAIDLFPVQQNSPLAALLPERVSDVRTERRDICPFISLPGTWEQYLMTMNGKQRHELRRKLRKAGDSTFNAIPGSNISALFELMTASDPGKRQFLTSDIRNFFQDIALAFENMGWLRLRGTYLSDRLISVLFSFHLQKTVYLYNSGFDPGCAHLSPGIVSICQDIQSAIHEGMTHYDFLRGDEKYKYQFGAEDRATVRILR
ncbi:MAG: GNAT family N-acetyltransferase [candidate division WOR-3 bacterium]|nr:MAG: GNAT family N-acetyltransferase [candidate division WOR-3 bacterium]